MRLRSGVIAGSETFRTNQAAHLEALEQLRTAAATEVCIGRFKRPEFAA